MTLFLHETHQVKGSAEEDFQAAFRDDGGWMDRIADADARLVYFANQVHGTGPSYRVTTITAVSDGAAWERLARRVHNGDLSEWVREADAMRHRVDAKVLMPVEWSSMGEIDLDAVPVEPVEHEPTLFMEDTGWPDVPLDDYIRYWGETYSPMLASQPTESALLEIKACWVPAFGTGRRTEGILWQRVHDLKKLMGLLTTEVPAELKGPGSYMAEALRYRDQWESRLLRTVSWSPMW